VRDKIRRRPKKKACGWGGIGKKYGIFHTCSLRSENFNENGDRSLLSFNTGDVRLGDRKFGNSSVRLAFSMSRHCRRRSACEEPQKRLKVLEPVAIWRMSGWIEPRPFLMEESTMSSSKFLRILSSVRGGLRAPF